MHHTQFVGVALVIACGARAELDGRIERDGGSDATSASTTPDASEPCTPHVLVDNVAATSVWVDGSYVYFASGSSLGVGRVSKSGGSITQYTTDREGTSVTTDDAYVYWIAGCCVVRKTKANEGGDVLAGLSTDSLSGIALDATNIYFADRTSTVWSLPKTGGTPTPLAVFSNQGPTAVAVYGDTVFAALIGPSGGVARVATDGTALTWIAHLDGSSSVVADATSVYWTSQGSPGSVREAAYDGSSLVVHSTGGTPGSIAIDDLNVYWADYTGLFRSPKGSTAVTALDEGDFGAVAVDDQCVYYTMDCCEFTSGQILQRTK